MIFGLFDRKRANRRIVISLYETLTEAGRRPVFYESMGVPDTVMGRFEMLSLHVALFLRRSREGSPAVRTIAQDIVDEFFLDIDHSIRELGVGDVGVPKKMKKFSRMFYGRLEAYAAALDAADRGALAGALGRNIYPDPKAPPAPHLDALAAYGMEADSRLAAVGDADILKGRLTLPDPLTDERTKEPQQ